MHSGDAIGTSPLTAPIDRESLRYFRDAIPRSAAPTLRSVLLLAGLVFVVVFGGGFLVLVFTGLRTHTDVGFLVLVGFLILGYVGFVVVLAVNVVMNVRRWSERRQYLLDRFARANRMECVPIITRPPLSGMIFGYGDSAIATDVRIRRGTTPFSVGNCAHPRQALARDLSLRA